MVSREGMLEARGPKSTPASPRALSKELLWRPASAWLSSDSLLVPPAKPLACLTSKSDSALIPQESEETLICLEETTGESEGGVKNNNNNNNNTKEMAVDNEGLIQPRKLHNPCLESIDRQNLHRELMFNQKLGRSVLNQKTELQKAMEKHKENQAKRMEEAKRHDAKTPFEKLIEQRAKRLEILEKGELSLDKEIERPEFLQIHDKLKSRMEAK